MPKTLDRRALTNVGALPRMDKEAKLYSRPVCIWFNAWWFPRLSKVKAEPFGLERNL